MLKFIIQTNMGDQGVGYRAIILNNCEYDHSLQQYIKLAEQADKDFIRSDGQYMCAVVIQSVWCRDMPYITFPVTYAEVEKLNKGEWYVRDICPF